MVLAVPGADGEVAAAPLAVVGAAGEGPPFFSGGSGCFWMTSSEAFFSGALVWIFVLTIFLLTLIYRIRWSGHRSMRPDMNYGFGTPNMMYAYYSITQVPAGSAPGRLELWPNPVRDRVRIRIPEPASGYPLVRLYDLRGTVTLSLQMELPGELDLPESLPGGVYILEVRTSGHIYRGRLLKH